MDGPSIHWCSPHGVEMIVAIDSRARGPALGGCRWRSYADSVAARREALHLARAMTLKAALARLPLGGGKAVVRGDPRRRTPEQLEAFGDFVESLGGSYVTAADMGTGEEQMAVIARRTRHVVGLPVRLGGCGDPAAFTARGVWMAVEAALAHVDRPLAGSRVAVQGVGQVGLRLVQLLIEAGAVVCVADPDASSLASLPPQVRIVPPESITSQPCDVFAPCGPAGVIDAQQVEELDCAVVCGAANNPLASDAEAGRLAERGILYAPDFLVNAGGLIHLARSLEGGSSEDILEALHVIPENLERVLVHAKVEGLLPLVAARELALRAVAEVERA